jgi:Xaa-Pro aminopeptidase
MFPGVAGFRHSDTVLVTEGGIDRLTNYPHGVEDLTILEPEGGG